MKRPTKQLLDDLLEDSVSSEFRTELMNKTLRSARHRRRARKWGLTAGSLGLAGILVVLFQIFNSGTSLNSHDKKIAVATPVPSEETGRRMLPEPAADHGGLREVNDAQLLALAGDKPVALIHQSTNESTLVFLQ